MLAGVFYFPTDYGIDIGELARAVEERGLESLFVCEHTHIPVSRKTPFPGGGELPKRYKHTHDPFVALSFAAAATKRIKLGTGIALIPQRDPIITAKQVASLDQLSGRAVHFRHGRRLERRRDGEPRRQVRHPLQAAARARAGHEGDVDQGGGRVPRRARRLRPRVGLPQAQAEAASSAVPGRRERPYPEARGGVLRRLVPARPRRLRSQGFGGAAAQGGDSRPAAIPRPCRSPCSALLQTGRSSSPIAMPASSACCSQSPTAAATRSCACSTRRLPSPRRELRSAAAGAAAQASVIFGGI